MKLHRYKKDGVEYGSYRVYLPAKAGMPGHYQSLGTDDPVEAATRAEAMLARHNSDTRTSEPVDTVDTNQDVPTGRDTMDAPPVEPIDGARLVNEWAGVNAPETPENSGEYLPPKPETQASPAQSPALMRSLAVVAVRMNVAAVAMSIQAFGRQPKNEPAPEETEVLQAAWEQQLAIWFADTEMAPWMIILASSAALGLTMYSDSDPIENEEAVQTVPGHDFQGKETV